jgi:hypothetical protein
VVEGGQDLGFTPKTRHAAGVTGERLGNNLDGDVAAQLGICGAVHLAHPAFAELGGDAVVGNGLGAHRSYGILPLSDQGLPRIGN